MFFQLCFKNLLHTVLKAEICLDFYGLNLNKNKNKKEIITTESKIERVEALSSICDLIKV